MLNFASQTSLEFMFQLILERKCSTITDTFNPFVLFSSQRRALVFLNLFSQRKQH